MAIFNFSIFGVCFVLFEAVVWTFLNFPFSWIWCCTTKTLLCNYSWPCCALWTLGNPFSRSWESICAHRCTRVENPGGGGYLKFLPKSLGGVKGFRKNCLGGSTYFGFYCIFINNFFENLPGRCCFIPCLCYSCALQIKFGYQCVRCDFNFLYQ